MAFLLQYDLAPALANQVKGTVYDHQLKWLSLMPLNAYANYTLVELIQIQ